MEIVTEGNLTFGGGLNFKSQRLRCLRIFSIASSSSIKTRMRIFPCTWDRSGDQPHTHPETEKTLTFEAPLPEDMQNLMQTLRLDLHVRDIVK